jgi:hypothetical protein
MAVVTAPHTAIRRFFRIVSPTCEEMTALISAMQDRRLPLPTRLRMRVHFLYCRCCRRVRDQFAFVRRACSQIDTAGADAELQTSLEAAEKENLRRALHRRP